MQEQVLSALSLIVVIYAVYRFRKWLRTLSQREYNANYNEISRGVHTLEVIANELDELDEIITDLQTCNDKALKGVRISVPSALRCNEYTVLTNGKDYSSRQLLAIAYSERDRKREMLQQAIADLYSSGRVKGCYVINEEESEPDTE